MKRLTQSLNVHFHMLFLDGVYTESQHGKTRFQRTKVPDQHELTELVHTISQRVTDFLEREGILERDEENSYLNLEEGDEDPMQQVLGCSISYRIAIGAQQGRIQGDYQHRGSADYRQDTDSPYKERLIASTNRAASS